MGKIKTSGKHAYADIGTIPATVPNTQTAPKWKDKLNNLFRSRREKRDIKAAEKRAVEIKDITDTLETIPFSDCDIEKAYVLYNAENPVIERDLCLYNATENLIVALKAPLKLDNADDTRGLNDALLGISSDFSECVRRGDANGSYFCLGALKNLIYEMRPRIANIKSHSIRRKYIEDITEYGQLAGITSQSYLNLFDIEQNKMRLDDVYVGYIDKSRELEDEYNSYILANGGEELRRQLLITDKTVAELKASGDEVTAHIISLASDYQFMRLPIKLAGILDSVNEQKISVHKNNIEIAETRLMSFPTLDSEELYNDFKDAVNTMMEEVVHDIVENNSRIDDIIAWNNYADELNRQLVAGDEIMKNQGIHDLDEKLMKIEAYANIKPLTSEQLDEKKNAIIAEKQARELEKKQAVEQALAQEQVRIQNTNRQNNTLSVDND